MHKPIEQNRYSSSERLLLTIEKLAPLRFGATIHELHREVIEEIGVYSFRTIYRDLRFLIEFGLVETVKTSHGKRYKWSPCRAASMIAFSKQQTSQC